jgi:hypothetical protein
MNWKEYGSTYWEIILYFITKMIDVLLVYGYG